MVIAMSNKLMLDNAITFSDKGIHISSPNIETSLELWESNKWLYDNDAIKPKDHHELTGNFIDTGNDESIRIITPWLNKLKVKKLIQLLEESFLDLELAVFEIVNGSWNAVSFDEKRFIKHISGLDGLREIWLVNELGFSDVWLVFLELDCEKELYVTSFCNNYLSDRMEANPDASKIGFLPLTFENFTGEAQPPLIRIKIGEDNNGE